MIAQELLSDSTKALPAEVASRLQAIHRRFCKHAPKLASSARKNLYTIALLLFLLPVSMLLFLFSLSSDISLKAVVLTGLTLKTIFVLVVMTGATMRRQRLGADLMAASRPFSPSAIPALASMVNRLCSTMGVKEESFDVRFIRSAAQSPSIFLFNKREHLLLPAGFLGLIHSDPEAAEAVLAHEFGHILQHDVSLWMDSIIYYGALTTVMRVEFALIGINSILLGFQYISTINEPWALDFWDFAKLLFRGVMPFFIALYFMNAFKKTRTASEIAADAAALAFSNGHALRRAVVRIREQSSSETPHIEKSRRLQMIDSALAGELEHEFKFLVMGLP